MADATIKELAAAVVEAWIAGQKADLGPIDALAPAERTKLLQAVHKLVRSKPIGKRVDPETLVQLAIKSVELRALVALRAPGREAAIAKFTAADDE